MTNFSVLAFNLPPIRNHINIIAHCASSAAQKENNDVIHIPFFIVTFANSIQELKRPRIGSFLREMF